MHRSLVYLVVAAALLLQAHTLQMKDGVYECGRSCGTAVSTLMEDTILPLDCTAWTALVDPDNSSRGNYTVDKSVR